jgi:hypothetical protein
MTIVAADEKKGFCENDQAYSQKVRVNELTIRK